MSEDEKQPGDVLSGCQRHGIFGDAEYSRPPCKPRKGFRTRRSSRCDFLDSDSPSSAQGSPPAQAAPLRRERAESAVVECMNVSRYLCLPVSLYHETGFLASLCKALPAGGRFAASRRLRSRIARKRPAGTWPVWEPRAHELQLEARPADAASTTPARDGSPPLLTGETTRRRSIARRARGGRRTGAFDPGIQVGAGDEGEQRERLVTVFATAPRAPRDGRGCAGRCDEARSPGRDPVWGFRRRAPPSKARDEKKEKERPHVP